MQRGALPLLRLTFIIFVFSDCMYDEHTYTHGSVFPAADHCNICMVSDSVYD